jgi:hypothetical protein
MHVTRTAGVTEAGPERRARPRRARWRALLPWALVVLLAVGGALCISAVAVSLVPWSSAPGADLVMDLVDRALVPVGAGGPPAP